MKRKLYAAYGSNLNISQMSRRCPAAEPYGRSMLLNHRLVFRGVADVEEADGASVPIGLWLITPNCERALDAYEGVPRLYRKFLIRFGDGDEALCYMMSGRKANTGYADYCSPSSGYYYGIEEGYRDFDLDLRFLRRARSHSAQRALTRGVAL